MRWRRYLLLGGAVLAALLGLGVMAQRHFRAVARERAEGLRNTLLDQLGGYREHARYLARLPPEEIANYLTYFRGLARVSLLGPERRPRFVVERFDKYFVALLDEKRLAGAPPLAYREGFGVDGRRVDVSPSLRNVVHYAEPRGAESTLVLTVYAEPLLQPLRAAGANLHDADGGALLGPLVDGEREWALGEGWRISVPVGAAAGQAALFFAVGAAVLVLGATAVLLSERQIRAQERASLERRLALSDRLGSVGLLASGIAHEINNPLEGIANWLRLGNLEKAEEGFERIRSIVRDLLAFARPEAEGAEKAEIRPCLQRALDLARFASVFKGVDVRTDVPEGLWVAGSPRSLEQVFLNLLLNAGGAMRDRSDRRVAIVAATAGGRVTVAVRDHGPGIDPADLPRLFDPFFSKSGGTGLGLSVSYGIVKAAGGELRADAAPGGGACFTVELEAR